MHNIVDVLNATVHLTVVKILNFVLITIKRVKYGERGNSVETTGVETRLM